MKRVSVLDDCKMLATVIAFLTLYHKESLLESQCIQPEHSDS